MSDQAVNVQISVAPLTSNVADARSERAESEFGERVGADALRFVRRFRAPVENVWAALTAPDRVAAWLGAPVQIEAVAGGAYAVALNGESTMDGRIVECEPYRRLAIVWHETSDGAGLPYATRPDDTSLVTFDLEPAAEGGTRLVFTHQYIRDGDIMAGFGAGWHALLDALETHVDNLTPVDAMALYERLKPVYDVVVAGGS
jgi:uncharacterized protein YndB with AHSA1/START domain